MRRLRNGRDTPPWPISLAVAISLSLVSPLYLSLFDSAQALTEFRGRAIGETTVEGIDASGYAYKYVAMTSAAAASLLALYFLLCRLERVLVSRGDPRRIRRELQGVQRLSELSIFLFLMRLILRQEIFATLSAVVYGLIAVLFLLAVVKLAVHRRSGTRNDLLRWVLDDSPLLVTLLFLPLPLPFVYWVAFEKPFDLSAPPLWVTATIYCSAVALAMAGYLGWLHRTGRTQARDVRRSGVRLSWSAAPWMAIPISIPLANEAQYNLPAIPARTVSLACMLVLCAAGALLFELHRRGVVRGSGCRLVSGFYFPLFVATCVLYVTHRHVGRHSTLDYFHLGELTLPTHQLFHFSSLPLIDLRPAHTLSDFFFPALYTWINGEHGLDMTIWLVWMSSVLTMVIVYFFLARLVSPVFAFLASCLTPLMATVTTYYAFALVPPMFLAAAWRRPTLARFCGLWASALALALWRIDFGIAGAAALILISGVELVRRPALLKVMALSLAIVAGGALLVIVLLAFVSHRPPVESLVFLVKSYTLRLATRTRSQIIDAYTTAAVLQYYLLPLVSLVYLSYYAVRRWIRRAYLPPGTLMLVYVAVFSLVMSVRSTERHSLIERFNPYLFVFLLALLPFFLGLGRGRRESIVARSLFLAVLAANTLFSLPPSSFVRSRLHHVFPSGELFALRDWNDGEQRIFYDDSRHKDLVRFLRDQLGPDQTFYDFTNSPLVYVFADKKFPTYVIPNIVQTSEEVQAEVVSDLDELRTRGRLPFVIFKQGRRFWDNVDGVPNEVRSYRIAELVYRHYVPFAAIGDYQVWIEASRRGEREAILAPYTRRHELPRVAEPRARGMRIVASDDREVTVRAEHDDPQVLSLYRLDDLPPLVAEEAWQLVLRYRSTVAGPMQVFFSGDGSELHRRISVVVEVSRTANGEMAEVNVPVRKPWLARRWTGVRFDPPKGSELTFGDAVLLRKDIDWRWLTPSDLRQSFSLRRLPYVWARYDPLRDLEHTEVLDVLLDEPAVLEPGRELVLGIGAGVDKANGNYLHLRVRPRQPVDGEELASTPRLSVEYGKAVTGSFDFDLVRAVRGSDERYVLRMKRGEGEVLHDAEAIDVGRRVVFKTTGPDPYVHKIFDLEGLPALDRSEDLYLVLEYLSSSAGELQVFFGFDGYWFEPVHSVRTEVEATIDDGQPRRLVVPLVVAEGARRLSNLRVDLPPELFAFERVEIVHQPSRYEDYLVRLSTQWAWAAHDVSELRLRTSGPVEIGRAVLRRGDGSTGR